MKILKIRHTTMCEGEYGSCAGYQRQSDNSTDYEFRKTKKET